MIFFQLYGAIYNLIRHGLPKVGIESTFVSIEDPEHLKNALTPHTKLVINVQSPLDIHRGYGETDI